MTYELKCQFCGRHLGFPKVMICEGFICTNSKCKARLNIKIVTPDSPLDQIRYEFQKEKK